MPRKVTGPVLWVFLLTVTVVKCDLERNGLRFTVEVVYSGDALVRDFNRLQIREKLN